MFVKRKQGNGGDGKKVTYNTGDSLVVMDPTNIPALNGFATGDEVG